jgi:Lantibiotic dehydratase, N terminus
MNAWRPSLTLDAGDGRDLLPPTADAPTRRVRESVERDIRAFNQTDDPHRAIALQARLPALTPGFAGPVVQFDAGLAMVGPIVLPRAVQTLAEDAAHILGRVGTWHRYPRHLSEYTLAFAERYGEQAEVPLLELLAVETGAGSADWLPEPDSAL